MSGLFITLYNDRIYYPDYYLCPIPALYVLIALIYLSPMSKHKHLFLGILYAIILWIATWLLLYKFFSAESSTSHQENSHIVTEPWIRAGEFGDMFGCLSCLFSGIASAGLLYTIYLQIKESSEQEKRAKIDRAVDEFYRRIEFIKKLESDIHSMKRSNPFNFLHQEQSIHYGVAAIQVIHEELYFLGERVLKHKAGISKCDIRHNETLTIWIVSVLTLANDIYDTLFPPDENNNRIEAKRYARVLTNSMSDQAKDILYFFSLCIPSTFLKLGLIKLKCLGAIHKEYISNYFKNYDLIKLYRENFLPKKYLTWHSPEE